MINFEKYKKGDYVKFLPSDVLNILLQEHKDKIVDPEYIKAIINLSGKTCKIDRKYDFIKSGISLDGDNPNYYFDTQYKWIFRDWMFEDPYEIEPNINNNIPNVFGDMIYNN